MESFFREFWEEYKWYVFCCQFDSAILVLTMDLRRARGIFRLNSRVPMEKLNTLFRDLVKKYHPDKVRDHPQWAHERMSEINDAYETLAEWISSPQPKPPDIPKKTDETVDEPIFEREIHPLTARETEEFHPSFGRFIDGLGLYYQYGLENPAYRTEGVRRFRYREALRSVEKGRDSMEICAGTHRHPAILAAARFGRLTVADIHLGEVRFTGFGHLRRFDERIRAARRSLDGAIKEILFPELVPRHLRGRHAAALYSCYAEFVLYLTKFDRGERQKAGILQTARYDAFMEILEYRNTGVLRF